MTGRRIGGVLVLAALVLLIGQAEEGPAWSLPVFLVLFVSGVLHLLGLVGTPGWVATARRHPQTVQRNTPTPPESIRSHCYRISKAAAVVLILLAVVVGALAALFAVLAAQAWVEEPEWASLLSLAAVGGALGAWLIVLEALKPWSRIVTTPRALRQERLWRQVEIPWDEIVALSVSGVVMGGAQAGSVFRVYSPGRMISFTMATEDAPDLARRISRACGLDWRRA